MYCLLISDKCLDTVLMFDEHSCMVQMVDKGLDVARMSDECQDISRYQTSI